MKLIWCDVIDAVDCDVVHNCFDFHYMSKQPEAYWLIVVDEIFDNNNRQEVGSIKNKTR